jgi:3,4-dihydroxy-9,10-secoandrosta-1,3,5(10)-triene-9,17-dione 4,5-dioxygenase
MKITELGYVVVGAPDMEKWRDYGVKTPGGFQLEYGAGGSVKDWSNYQVFESTRGSHCGHMFLGA